MTILLKDINNVNILGDTTPNALRSISYNINGTVQEANAIDLNNTTSPLISGANYKLTNIINTSSEGNMRYGFETSLLYDSVETTSNITSRWATGGQAAGGTVTVALGTGTALTAGTASGSDASRTSARAFQLIDRTCLVYRCLAVISAHTEYNVIELGFGSAAAIQLAPVVDGVFWRKNGAGRWVPTIVLGSSVEIHGDFISNDTFIASIPTTDRASFKIQVEENRAIFTISTMADVTVNEQIIDFPATVGGFSSSHLIAYERIYNLAATSISSNIKIMKTSVSAVNLNQYTYQQLQISNGNDGFRTVGGNAAFSNYTNSVAPASATLSNTAAGYTTAGGQWQFAAVGGAETDYALFGVTLSVGKYAFNCTGITINAYNTGAANSATTPTVLQWGVAFNSSAASLATAAPQSPMRQAIGSHTFPINAAIGASGGPAVSWNGFETVRAGKLLHIILKIPIGAATASQIIRGTCAIQGYAE